MSLIPAALWPFCVALSWSVDWYTYFYIAVLYNFVFLEFCQWQSLGLHWKRGTQMWAMSLCLFGKAAIFFNFWVHVLLCFTKFDKSVFFLQHYIFHVTTQNMESRKKKVTGCGMEPKLPFLITGHHLCCPWCSEINIMCHLELVFSRIVNISYNLNKFCLKWNLYFLVVVGLYKEN